MNSRSAHVKVESDKKIRISFTKQATNLKNIVLITNKHAMDKHLSAEFWGDKLK